MYNFPTAKTYYFLIVCCVPTTNDVILYTGNKMVFWNAWTNSIVFNLLNPKANNEDRKSSQKKIF